MGIRTLSGAVFALIIVLFFMLRQFVSEYFFYLLIAIFSAIGTYEVSKAVGYDKKDASFWCTIVFGVLLVPIFILFQLLNAGSVACFMLVNVLALVFAIIAKRIPPKKGETFNPYSARIVAIYYPSIFIIFMCMLNAFKGEHGFISLLLLFVISPLTDTMAYFVGFIYNKIRKGKAKKLAPVLSPKKTVAGAIGGLIGGALGSILVLLIFKPSLRLDNPWIFFVIVGVIGSLFNQLGDLFESFIKRNVGLKDMGNVIPGHGGVMDRIDGMSFCSVVLYFAFLIIIYFA